MLKLKALFNSKRVWFVIRHGDEEMRVAVARGPRDFHDKYLLFDGPQSFVIDKEEEPR